jgi:hypothetical protein
LRLVGDQRAFLVTFFTKNLLKRRMNMPEYCYIAIKGDMLLRINFGSNHAQETEKKGDWKTALETNLQVGILPHETFAMFVCYMFQHWPIYDYLSSLEINASIAIFDFVHALGRTRFEGDIRSLNNEIFDCDLVSKRYLY